MKEFLTASEIAQKALPGLPASKRGIAKLAARAGWARIPGATRTRTDGAVEYSVTLLPETARHVLAGRAVAAPVIAPPGPATIERDARMAILTLQKSFADALGLKVRAADAPFAKAYNAGHIAADDWVRAEFPEISERSIRKWRSWRDKGDPRLAGKRGGSRKPQLLAIANDGAVADLIAGALVRQPHLNARHVRALVLAAFGPNLEVMTDDGALLDVPVPQERAVREYIAAFKEDNKITLAALTDPDAFKSKYRVSGFSRDHVERVNQLWETDASPADMLCLEDGKPVRYSIYVLLDVYSRRVLTLVSKTPRAEAVLLLVRKAVLAWGVPEKVKTDNGSDFKAHAVRRAFASLGIAHHMCAPFSPEQKGKVERAIGTLQRDLMPLLSGFIGHSVAQRKAIEARKAFSARLGEDKIIDVTLTGAQLQAKLDAWAAEDYNVRKHTALNTSPVLKAQECRAAIKRVADERALDLLLAPVGMRTVGKQGLKIDTAFFTAVNLLPGEKVLVRHDPSDMGRVFCFKEDGSEFLCEAICYERLGVNPSAAIAYMQKKQAEDRKERSAAFRKAARQFKQRDIFEQTRPTQPSASVIMLPKPAVAHTTPHLDAAGEAASPKIATPSLTEKQKQVIEELQETWQPPDRAKAHTVMAKVARVVDLPESPKHRFRRAYLIEQAIACDAEVSIDDALWLGNYQGLPEYKGQKTLFETFGEEWLFDGVRL